MYHSIDFFYIDPLTNEGGSKVNTWDDWGLVGSSRPTIAPPKPVTNLIKIVGATKFYNASEILTGYPTYESRVGSIEFIVLNDWNKPDAKRWIDIYNEVCEYLHGHELCCVLEDEPEYYYTGIFSVNEFKSGEYNSNIVIDYELQPYKYNRAEANKGWIWDIMNFETGILTESQFAGLEVSYGNTLTRDWTGVVSTAPVVPTILIKSWTCTNPMEANCNLKFSFIIKHKNGKVTTRGTSEDNYTIELKRRDMVIDPTEQTLRFRDTAVLPLLTLYDDVINFTASTDDQSSEITFDLVFREGRI